MVDRAKIQIVYNMIQEIKGKRLCREHDIKRLSSLYKVANKLLHGSKTLPVGSIEKALVNYLGVEDSECNQMGGTPL